MIPLHKTIHRIEKLAYDKGVNVALDNAEDSQRYKHMRTLITQAFNYQIALVAKPKIIENFLLFTKTINPPLLVGISVVFSKDHMSDLIEFPAFLQWAGQQGGQAALDKLGITATFTLKNPDVIKYFDDYSNLILNSVDETTKKWVAEKIQEGKDKLLNPQEIANSLTQDGALMSQVRAERIVITETAKALVTVELEAARRYGILEKIWRTSLDDRVDPLCLDLEGERTGISDSFPGGYDGPPAHVSCRCFVEEVIPDNWQQPADVWTGE